MAPSALNAFAVLSLGCGFIILFFSSEYCTARLYEKFGRAHVECGPNITSLSEFLKGCLAFMQYAAGGIAVTVALLQHPEGEHIGSQCLQMSVDPCFCSVTTHPVPSHITLLHT